MSIPTYVPSQSFALVNGTRGLASDLGGTTVLVSGWAQLAVCILIVVLCCLCTLLCLCTSCICCTTNTENVHGEVGGIPTAIIADKPPSYEEAQRASRNGLPSYQEALRRESQISWIHIPNICGPHGSTQCGHNGSIFQYK